MKLLKLSIVLIILGSIYSCSKYSEGPEFTLISKKKRITGAWKDIIAYGNGYTRNWEFEKNGRFRGRVFHLGSKFSVFEGYWNFNKNKDSLIIILESGTQYEPTGESPIDLTNDPPQSYEIIKLTETSLILNQQIGVSQQRYEFIGILDPLLP